VPRNATIPIHYVLGTCKNISRRVALWDRLSLRPKCVDSMRIRTCLVSCETLGLLLSISEFTSYNHGNYSMKSFLLTLPGIKTNWFLKLPLFVKDNARALAWLVTSNLASKNNRLSLSTLLCRRRHHASEVNSSSRHDLSAMYPGVVRSLTEWRNTPGMLGCQT
jgi:hypothetical protein